MTDFLVDQQLGNHADRAAAFGQHRRRRSRPSGPTSRRPAQAAQIGFHQRAAERARGFRIQRLGSIWRSRNTHTDFMEKRPIRCEARRLPSAADKSVELALSQLARYEIVENLP